MGDQLATLSIDFVFQIGELVPHQRSYVAHEGLLVDGVPAVLLGHLGQKQAAFALCIDEQPVGADLDLVDLTIRTYNRGGELVITVRAPSGKLLGVLCRFKSGNPEYSRSGSPVTRFAAYYWEDVCGGKPEFVSKESGLVAEKAVNRAGCAWLKDPSNGRLQTKDEVTFVMGKAMLRPSRY